MTVEDRISAIEKLATEFISVSKSIEGVCRQQNAIYDRIVIACAPHCSFDTELKSAAFRAVWADEEYLKLQDEFQRLTDRKDIIIKELESSRWSLLFECTSLFPADFFIRGLARDVRH